MIERRLFGPKSSLFDPTSSSTPAPEIGPTDLVIALEESQSRVFPVLEVLFDGVTGEAAFLRAVARSRAPDLCLSLRIGDTSHDVVRASLAVEHETSLSLALDQVLARLVTLLLQAVRRLENPGPLTDVTLSQNETAENRGPFHFMARGLARKIAGRLPGGRRGPDHWRIGLRRTSVGDTRVTKAWSAQPFTIVPDDGRRFYADPMMFEHEGRNYLFFEDYPYASGKGVISMVEVYGDGALSSPRTVLEQPVHLSYPLVLSHNGAIYMLPEMSAARRVQLFRADPFPDRWVPDRILIDDVVAADATPIQDRGIWWLFATLSDDGGSSWDQLGLFYASDLLGPWTPHKDNPVLVDAGAARPAGAMWHENGTLMRVAQDCRSGYGAGLAICRVDRLDQDRYAQTLLARLAPPETYGANGIHTLNRLGEIEVIDLRFSPLRADASF